MHSLIALVYCHLGSTTDGDRDRGRVGRVERVRQREPDAGRLLAEGQEGHHKRRQVQNRRRGSSAGQSTTLKTNSAIG